MYLVDKNERVRTSTFGENKDRLIEMFLSFINYINFNVL